MKLKALIISISMALLTLMPMNVSAAQDINLPYIKDGFTTTADHVSIAGSCDPAYPLTINGNSVSTTKNGYFTYYPELSVGNNSFTLVNNNSTKTINVVRNASSTYSGSSSSDSSLETILPYTENWYGVVSRNHPTVRTRPDEATDDLTEPYAKGTTVQITGETESYFRTTGDRFIYKESMEECYNDVLPHSIISGYNVSQNDENIVVALDLTINSGYTVDLNQKSAKITLLNSYGQYDENKEYVEGDSVKSFAKSEKGNDAYFDLEFNQSIVGYKVEFSEDHVMTISFKKATVLQDSTSLKGATVLLDAGHGDYDTGTIGLGDVPEKTVNLNVLKKVQAYLESKGANVITTRNDDTFISLENRVQETRDIMPDIFVSIHSNAYPTTVDYSKASNFITFYSYSAPFNAQEAVNTAVEKAFPNSTKPIEINNFAVTRVTNCPAMLLEMGFMTNPEQYEEMITDKWQSQIATAIGTGIENYLHSVK